VFGQAGYGGYDGGVTAVTILSTLVEGDGASMMMLVTGALVTIAGTTHLALATALQATNNTDISIFTFSMPHGALVFVGAEAEGTENVYTANSTTVKTGYYVQKQDKMLLRVEVVKYDSMAKGLYLSLEYEYISNAAKEWDGWIWGLSTLMDVPKALLMRRVSLFSGRREEGSVSAYQKY
jgi:hypothetical protein